MTTNRYAVAAIILAYITILGITLSGIVSFPKKYLRDSSTPLVFCGNSESVPAGYDALGTRFQCLRKGYGAGKHNQIREGYTRMLAGLVVVSVSITVIMYLVYMAWDLENTQKDDDE